MLYDPHLLRCCNAVAKTTLEWDDQEDDDLVFRVPGDTDEQVQEQLSKHNAAIRPFVEAYGGLDLLEKRATSRAKRKAESGPGASTKKRGKATAEEPTDEEVAELFANGKLKKLTVAKLKVFCARHSLPDEGKKADLLDAVTTHLESKA